jgi:hypothetical protein
LSIQATSPASAAAASPSPARSPGAR